MTLVGDDLPAVPRPDLFVYRVAEFGFAGFVYQVYGFRADNLVRQWGINFLRTGDAAKCETRYCESGHRYRDENCLPRVFLH